MKYLATMLLLVSSLAFCQEDKKPKLHTFAQTMKIMEESKIRYDIFTSFDPASVTLSSPVLSDNYFLQKNGEGFSLEEVKISNEAEMLRTEARGAYQRKEYDKAIELYTRIFAMEPRFTLALTLIGDSYAKAGQMDSAIAVFKRVIDYNFIDYDAHWFLGDVCAQSGEPAQAVRELTIAHVLNVNNTIIKKTLILHRLALERQWDEWDFTPQYELSDSGATVKINAARDWFGYAIVKAAWKYEPGYAESVDGKKRENNAVNWSEEKEAVMAMLADSTRSERLKTIIQGGYFTEFVLYELTAKKYPQVMMSLPREEFDRVVEYVDKFH